MRVRASRIVLSLVIATLAVTLISLFRAGTRNCGNGELSLSITTEASDVELGKAFPLTVDRIAGNRLTPQAFDERSLAPLVTRLESSSIVNTGNQIEETRHYAAYAFTPGSVTVPAISFGARLGDSGNVTPATSKPLHLRVTSLLDPKSPGAPEGPGEMLPTPRRWLLWLAGSVVVPGLVGLAWWRRRRAVSRTPVPVEPPTPAGPGPDVLALESLARLRARDDVGADITEASDVVRTYAAQRFGVRAGEMTTSELLASLTQAGARLREVLVPSDLVKFAEHAPTAEERTRVLDAAEAFVLATRTTP